MTQMFLEEPSSELTTCLPKCLNATLDAFPTKSTLHLTFLWRHLEADVSSCDQHTAVIMATILQHQNAGDVLKQ